MNAEAAARAKRERRRANEQKTKTIQRMQLQMTAPLDIGLEHTDSALQTGHDEDMFDLGDTTKALAKKGGLSRLLNAGDDDSSDEEVEDDEDQGMSTLL